MNYLLLLCLTLMVLYVDVVNGQQCLDLMPPFTPTSPLRFCERYSKYGCCTSRDDERLRQMYEDIRRQSRMSDERRMSTNCLRHMKALLCARCSPLSAEIFQVDLTRTGNPRIIAGLCDDFCEQFYDRCADNLQHYFSVVGDSARQTEEASSLLSLTDSSSSAQFCQAVALPPEKSQYCHPYVDYTFGESSRFTADKVNSTDCVCFQSYGISLRNPVVITNANDGTNRLFIAEQIGVVKIMFSDGSISQNDFLNIESKVYQNGNGFSDLGLLGLTFHPKFKDNHKLYVYYTTKTGSNSNVYTRLEEYRVKDTDADSVDLSTRRVIIEIQKDTVNNAGGSLLFGKDGYLYIFTGDDGGDGDAMEISQDLFMLSGKVLRLNVDTTDFVEGKEYSIPSDNPFIGKEEVGLPEIYAWGLRNPRKCSTDREKSEGRIFCGDVGMDTYEEVNVIKRKSNYGWNIKEGTADFCPDCLRGLPKRKITEPIFEYRHTIGVSVVGGNIYRGCRNPNLYGQYIFGDLKYGLFHLEEDSQKQTWAGERLEVCPPSKCVAPLTSHIKPYILSFGEDINGELYVSATSSQSIRSRSGRLYKIVDPIRRGNPDHCSSARPADGKSAVTGDVFPYGMPLPDEEDTASIETTESLPPAPRPIAPRQQRRPEPGAPETEAQQRGNQRPRSRSRSRFAFLRRLFNRRGNSRNEENGSQEETQPPAAPQNTQQGSGIMTLGDGAVVVDDNQGATVIRWNGKK